MTCCPTAKRPLRPGDGLITIPASFGPCEGRVFMVTDRAIGQVRISAPRPLAPGASAVILAAILGDDGRPIDAIVPVKIDLIDPAGRAAEFSGYYGAKDGAVEIAAAIAPNDAPGLWRIHVRELASGLTADAYLRVAAGAAESIAHPTSHLRAGAAATEQDVAEFE